MSRSEICVKDRLSAECIRAGLTTSMVGRSLVYLPETTSTNDEARRLARAGGADGLLVITDHQTAGRGRLQRRWIAPPGSSLLMSLLLRPALQPAQVQQLTMISGLSVCDAVEAQTGLRAGLKWPNDIVVSDAKLGGILTEIEVQDNIVEYAIVGIGLNVGLKLTQLPKDLLMRATSLCNELGRPVSRVGLLWAFLLAFEKRYFLLKDGQSPHVEWSQRLTTLGRLVTVAGSSTVWAGMAEGVDRNGALLVRHGCGELETVLAGDVSVRFGQTGSDLL